MSNKQRINHRVTCAVLTALSASSATAVFAEAADETPSEGLEEITVTAQRRSESIQNVPITIQAISGDQLASIGVHSFDDVLKLLPNVTQGSNGPGQGTIYMRGLSAGLGGSQSSASINPFPNVATYLDDQSLSFPGRNLDVYMVDMERVEVLEGPQGTLFGGGAEAGAVRYITNKPNLTKTEASAETGWSWTAHGDPNYNLTAVLNVPLISGTLAARGVFYDERRGGYIDNVPSTFTRNPALDRGPSAYSSSYPAHLDTYNNYNIAARDQNWINYRGFRLSALYQINDDWDALIQDSYQYLDAEGMPFEMQTGLDFQPLKPLEETSFMPSWNRDKANSTAWTVNGKIGDIKALYTGAYLWRNVDANMDYTNYSRTAGGFYYSCTGGGGSNFGGSGPATCYSPVMGWHDYFKATHQSHEFRFSTPDSWRLRGLLGFYWEDFRIKDDMNFLQKTIPSCTPANLAAALAGGPVCLSNVTPIDAAIDPSTRGDTTNFGEDMQRGYHQKAVFFSTDYDLIPKVLTLTAGTRWYKYDEFQHGSQYTTSERAGCFNAPNGACLATPFHYTADYSGFRSRANLTWHITPDAMLYYTFSQGYRPGAFNRLPGGRTTVWVDANGVPLPNGVPKATGDTKPAQFNKPTAYGPDSLINNEVGFKSEFWDHRLQINLSGYRMDWKDVQTLIYNPPVYGNTTFGIQGPNYRIWGGELQLAFKPIQALTLQASGSYNDAKQSTSPCIKSLGITQYTPNNPTPAGQCITQVRSGNVNTAIVDPLGAVGSTPAFSPKLSYNLRARYDWTFESFQAFAQAGMSHVGSMDNQPSSFPSGEGIAVPYTTWLRYTMPGYETYDLTLGASKGPWESALFCQNCSDRHASLFTTSGQDVKADIPLRPRIIGFRVGVKF